ncbi:DMT family transporter [Neobacillus jeddahensis]|uniref:DMT family transporter n=1 Tax=Neobacillus jeddahensis TaxID=1461580 RepID=UPI00058ECC53|nr:DMT family transporter [Neobacillus jeddahensis]
MNVKNILALLGLAGLWGASFLFIRIASPVLGPFLTIQVRVTLAVLTLILYMIATRQSAQFRRMWKQFLIIGTLNAVIPFTLIAFSALYLPASLSAVLNSLTPLFTALVVWGWMKESLSLRKFVGIIMGAFGVFILVGWSSVPFTTETQIAVCLAILSTISYGIAGVYAKKAFSGISPLALATGQQAGASLLLLPFTLTHLPSTINSISAAAVWSVFGLAIFCTAIAYLLYFYLIDSVGPTKTLSVTFLIPVFGIAWGSLFLHEQITAGIIVGLLVILASVFLISNIRVQTLASGKQMSK